MKKKMFLPLDEDHSERECPRCHKLIYNKKEGCPDPGCTAQHTPTPYETLYNSKRNGYNIQQASGPMILGVIWDKDDADYIVRAVNSHEALLEAAKLAKHALTLYGAEAGARGLKAGNTMTDAIEALYTAIAQAEGVK